MLKKSLWKFLYMQILLVHYTSQNCLLETMKCHLDWKGLNCLEKKYLSEFPCQNAELNFVLSSLSIENKIFENLPSNILQGLKTETLSLKNNGIKTIADEVFDRLDPCLKTLDLQSNQISYVKSRHFKNIKNCLVNLNLEQNQIETIDGSFDDLVKLENLDLSRNLIKTITNDSFKDLISLSSLNLNENRIIFIEEQAFRNLSKISRLDINENQLTIIQDSHFKHLKSLHLFDLNGNNLSFKDSHNLFEMENIISLILFGNAVESIKNLYFNKLKYFDTLNLSKNRIKNIFNGDFGTEDSSLTQIDLSFNLISFIEENSLDPLANLRYLALNYNQLKTIDGVNLTRLGFLVFLDLSNNQLESFENPYFKYLRRINALHLSFNRLKSLPNDFFIQNNNINYLNFKKNYLTRVENWGIRNNLINIDLSENYIHTVHAKFDNLSILSTLNLSRNNLNDVNFLNFSNHLMLYKLDISWNRIRTIEHLQFHLLDELAYLDLSNNPIMYFKSIRFNLTALRRVIISISYLDETGLTELRETLRPKIRKILPGLNLIYLERIFIEDKHFELNCSMTLFFLARNINLNMLSLNQITTFFHKCIDFELEL
jgi:Leucine-rich repeat (LRR) protein